MHEDLPYVEAAQKSHPVQLLLALYALVRADLTLRTRRFPGLRESVRGALVRRSILAMGSSDQELLITAIHRASVFLPVRTHCLVYSSALVWLLRQYGLPAQCVIGIRSTPFESHAWVENEGVILGPKVGRQSTYTVIDVF